MASGSANLIAFQASLDQHGITYVELDNSAQPGVRIPYDLDSLNGLNVFFWFDADGEALHYGTGVLAHVPENRTEQALKVVNEANVHYRWLTFFLDSDNDIAVSGDHLLVPNVVGDTCFILLSRILSIVNDAYPHLMNGIWSS